MTGLQQATIAAYYALAGDSNDAEHEALIALLEALQDARAGQAHPPTPRHVQTVSVDGRLDGLYVFARHADAQSFLRAVEQHGGTGVLDEEPVNDHHQARALIDAESDSEPRNSATGGL